MLNGNQIIKGRWKLVKKIGQGAFGEIYQAKNIITNEMVAIKVEKVDSKKQVLKLEVAVLKKLQDSPYVCRFLNCGRFSDFNYMVMELLGDNISEFRRKQPDGKFSLGTTLKLGLQMLRAIEAVHELGYLHRDIKPSNFAMGLPPLKKRTVFIIDFGLARKFLLPTGEVRPARDSTGFRGTARYASINSHLSRDLGRRDDLWSLLYVLIEFAKGSLPWRKIKDKDQIGELKIQYNNNELVCDLPSEFLLFMEHLQTLRYLDKPDYNYLFNLMQDLCIRIQVDDNTLFDWEKDSNLNNTSSNTSINSTNSINNNNINNSISITSTVGINGGISTSLNNNNIEDSTSNSVVVQHVVDRGAYPLLVKESTTPNNNKLKSSSSRGRPSNSSPMSPLVPSPSIKTHGNTVSYVSSNLDPKENIDNYNTSHRRCASLPVNLVVSDSFQTNFNVKSNGKTSSTSKFNHNPSPIIASTSVPQNLNRSKSLFVDTKQKNSIPLEDMKKKSPADVDVVSDTTNKKESLVSKPKRKNSGQSKKQNCKRCSIM